MLIWWGRFHWSFGIFWSELFHKTTSIHKEFLHVKRPESSNATRSSIIIWSAIFVIVFADTTVHQLLHFHMSWSMKSKFMRKSFHESCRFNLKLHLWFWINITLPCVPKFQGNMDFGRLLNLRAQNWFSNTIYQRSLDSEIKLSSWTAQPLTGRMWGRENQ